MKKKGEDVSEKVSEQAEKISNMFGNIRDQVTDKANAQYESSEYAKEKVEEIEKAKNKVTSTSFFGSISSAISETFAEAKEDLLGESARDTSGRRKQPRRRVKPGQNDFRQKMSNLEKDMVGEHEDDISENEKELKNMKRDEALANQKEEVVEGGVGEIESEWESAIDPESGDTYYYNTMTGRFSKC